MTTQAISLPRPDAGFGEGPRRGGFGSLLRAEWVKFRSVRGWVIGMIVAAILIMFFDVFVAANGGVGCQMNGGPLRTGRVCLPYIPYGPGGEVVTDSFSFVRQPLTGNGTLTARVTSLTGEHSNLSNGLAQGGSGLVPGLVDWAKAGIIIKRSTHQGSAYAAMMVTGGHGVRMQYNFTGDIAGMPGNTSAAHPRWLRLTRSGDTITGYDSADGAHWTRVGTVQLAGLPATVQVGLFATSPNYFVTQNSFGGNSNIGGSAQATGSFDHVSLTGSAPGTWTGTTVGGGGPVNGPGPGGGGPGGGQGPPSYTRTGGTFTLTGSGDIAPITPGGSGQGLPTTTIGQALVGVFLGLIAIVVVAAMFFSTEFRRGLIRTTLAATPRRGAVLAAKAAVIAAVAFVVGLVAVAISIALGVPKQENGGQVLLPATLPTEIRVIVGTAAMLALAAVLAVSLGAILRRSAAAITVAILLVFVPYLLALTNAVPAGVGEWLLRVTPAAAVAIEQSIPRYSQVHTVTSPMQGYYPLSPYAGFGVLCLWTAAALALALFVLRRRDA